MKNLQDLIPRLRDLGWNVWPDSEADFIPWGGDDLIPIAEEGSLALKQAIRGWAIPSPRRRPWRAHKEGLQNGGSS
jgi:hypothetical protein